MKRLLIIGLFVFNGFLNLTTIWAQGAFPFIKMDPSPAGNGLAGAYNALPTTDAFGAWYNPAQLGNFGMERTLAWNFYAQRTDLLPGFDADDPWFESSALALGYDRQINRDMTLSVGLSRIHSQHDYGKYLLTDDNGNPLGTYYPEEFYTQYAVGIGLHTFLDVNIGYGLKKITLKLYDIDPATSLVIAEKSKASAEDFGLQISVPVLSERMIQVQLYDVWKPFLAFHGGASLMNYGGLAKYLGEETILPRQAKFGLGLTAALSREYWGEEYRVIQFDWSTEARDDLYESQTKYAAFPGRINFYKHLIETGSDVETHRGFAIGLFETIRYSHGRYKGQGWEDEPETFGLRLGTRGLFRYLGSKNKTSALNVVYRHLELEYQHSEFDADKEHLLDGRAFKGVLIAWNL